MEDKWDQLHNPDPKANIKREKGTRFVLCK